MKNILIFGAGSIGNHMAYACRKLGLVVYITDIDPAALIRMKNKIYPKRYKKWDEKIKIFNFNEILNTSINFELIILGTPPETHFDLYKLCKENLKYKKILIEKPIINYSNKNINNLKKISKNDLVFCGYNHSISPAFLYFMKKISLDGNIKSVKVNWCEGWNGILKAHYWLKNEFDSYLGDYKRGGGSLQEHSHGFHLLFIIILKVLKFNLKKLNFNSFSIFKKLKNKKYDILSSFNSNYNKINIVYTTDLITNPSKKNIIIFSSNKIYEFQCSYKKNLDLVTIKNLNNNLIFTKTFKKTRSSEFENEIKHLLKINSFKKSKETNLNTNIAFVIIDQFKKHFKNEK